jgi:hypothetical protein
MLNLQIFLANIYCDFFFNWQTEEKNMFRNKKFVVLFSTAQTEKNVRKKIVEQIGKNI